MPAKPFGAVRVAEIIVVRQRYHPVYRRKSGTVKHFHQGAFARIAGHIGETLIFMARLLAQKHRRLFLWQAHAFQQQALLRQAAEMANRPQRILQVVEQSEAKNKIKSAQLQDHLFLDVALFEQDMWEPAPRFGYVFSSRVEPANIQTAIRKRLRKKSGAAARIHCIRKPYPGLQPSYGVL